MAPFGKNETREAKIKRLTKLSKGKSNLAKWAKSELAKMKA
jgi:hypothetical protein